MSLGRSIVPRTEAGGVSAEEEVARPLTILRVAEFLGPHHSIDPPRSLGSHPTARHYDGHVCIVMHIDGSDAWGFVGLHLR